MAYPAPTLSPLIAPLTTKFLSITTTTTFLVDYRLKQAFFLSCLIDRSNRLVGRSSPPLPPVFCVWSVGVSGTGKGQASSSPV